MRKKLLFLGCNSAQIPYLRVLKKIDLEIIGVDLNENAPGKSYCNDFFNIGYDNLEELVEIGIKKKFTNKDLVFTAAAQFAHKGASHFAKYFNIPYPSEATVDLCLDKAAYYEYFQKNNIPLPQTWYVNNEYELNKIVKSRDETKRYYLKSDYSKNPNYVYHFIGSDIPFKTIFWGKDRYLRNLYILQEEFWGISLRINIYANRFNVFDFLSGELTHKHHHILNKLRVIDTLRNFMTSEGLKDWLIKFDIILQDEHYVVLDIGMEPPFRMNKESQRKGINFAKFYIDQYIFNEVNYPKILD
jgi:hypothetical protein